MKGLDEATTLRRTVGCEATLRAGLGRSRATVCLLGGGGDGWDAVRVPGEIVSGGGWVGVGTTLSWSGPIADGGLAAGSGAAVGAWRALPVPSCSTTEDPSKSSPGSSRRGPAAVCPAAGQHARARTAIARREPWSASRTSTTLRRTRSPPGPSIVDRGSRSDLSGMCVRSPSLPDAHPLGAFRRKLHPCARSRAAPGAGRRPGERTRGGRRRRRAIGARVPSDLDPSTRGGARAYRATAAVGARSDRGSPGSSRVAAAHRPATNRIHRSGGTRGRRARRRRGSGTVPPGDSSIRGGRAGPVDCQSQSDMSEDLHFGQMRL